jgi:hypothetical protein
MSIAPNAAPAAAFVEPPRHSNLYREQAIPESPESNLSFWDLLDVINPLQHIPLVGTIYRALTGDEISAPARVAGGTLFGGVVGFAASVASAIVEDKTGRDPGGHMVAMLFGDETAEPASGTAVAEAPAAGPVTGPSAVPQTAVAMAVPPREGAPTGRFYALPPREPAPQVPPPQVAETAAVPSGAWPPGGPAPLPPELVADAMMSALDKYEAASRLGRTP